VILRDHKVIFIHVPKCAGTTVTVSICGTDWDEVDPATKHFTARETRRRYGRDLWDSSFRFSVVRNPLDRMVSLFVMLHLVKPELEFEPFIRQVCSPQGLWLVKGRQSVAMHRTACQYLCDEDGSLMVDFVARQENMAEDFEEIIRRSGVGHRVLLHAMKGDYQRDRDYWYSPETRRLVLEHFAEDFLRFGYDPEGRDQPGTGTPG
jgi:hypothetical protein